MDLKNVELKDMISKNSISKNIGSNNIKLIDFKKEILLSKQNFDVNDKTFNTVTKKCINCNFEKSILVRDKDFNTLLICKRCHYVMKY